MKTSKSKYLILILSFIVIVLTGCEPSDKVKKPVIYLYPITEQTVNVKLEYKGKLTYTYPEYKDGWKVKAEPDGTLTNFADNKEYSYLYWEGVSNNKWDMSKGFVVKGNDKQYEMLLNLPISKLVNLFY